jgi:phosphatidate cytidylyltransferase
MQDLDSDGIRNFALLFSASFTIGLCGYLLGRIVNRRPIEGSQVRRGLVFMGVYVVIYIVLAAPPVILMAALSLIGWQAARELFNAYRPPAENPQRLSRTVSLVLAIGVPFVAGFWPKYLTLFLFGGLGLLIVLPLFNQDYQHTLNRIGCGALSVLFAANMSALLYVQRLPHGIALGWLVASLIAATDGFSGVFGGLFGRHYLIPKISPRKTVEGALFTLIFMPLMTYLLSETLRVQMPIGWWVASGLITCGLAQAGDLIASTFKREAGIKDYGRIFPYQGGVLDRFDSYILAAPVFYLLVAAWLGVS